MLRGVCSGFLLQSLLPVEVANAVIYELSTACRVKEAVLSEITSDLPNLLFSTGTKFQG